MWADFVTSLGNLRVHMQHTQTDDRERKPTQRKPKGKLSGLGELKETRAHRRKDDVEGVPNT